MHLFLASKEGCHAVGNQQSVCPVNTRTTHKMSLSLHSSVFKKNELGYNLQVAHANVRYLNGKLRCMWISAAFQHRISHQAAVFLVSFSQAHLLDEHAQDLMPHLAPLIERLDDMGTPGGVAMGPL